MEPAIVVCKSILNVRKGKHIGITSKITEWQSGSRIRSPVVMERDMFLEVVIAHRSGLG